MKRVFILLALLLAIASGWYYFGKESRKVDFKKPTDQAPTARIQGSKTSEAKAGIPKRLIIDKLSIDAYAESVGLDAQGRMDVPKNADNVAWYNLGFKPGDKGSAVISGHFDKVTGAPAVFYNLTKLQTGDEIKVLNDNGSTLTFRVVNEATYGYDKVPLQEIFASTDKPRLNLITCDGVFDQTTKNYSKRYVVYAELANE